jgi:acetoin utilization deacetylase AcuC-like enzyme
MGTLFRQEPRNHLRVETSDLDEFVSSAVKLAQKHKIHVCDVIAAGRVLELSRRNDLFVNNGDAFDEQIAGIGELLQKLSDAVESLKKAE